MAVNIEHLKGQMARTASVAHEARYADKVRTELVSVVKELLDVVAELRADVDELKRHAKG